VKTEKISGLSATLIGLISYTIQPGNVRRYFSVSRMLLLVLLLQLPDRPVLTIFSNGCTGSRYRNVLITKLSSSFSLLLNVTCAISSQSSLLDPLNHPQSTLVTLLQTSVDSSLKITDRSFRYAALSCGTNFLLLFVFLISSILHHHSALLHRHALIMDRLLTFLVAF